MKRKLKRVILIVIFIMVIVPLQCNAHSGRTDANGGHRDNNNKSGLGPYHYHCGGHPAHLHQNGVCPYNQNPTQNKSYNTNTNSKGNSNQNVTTQKNKTQSQTPSSNTQPKAPKVINVTSIQLSSDSLQLTEGENIQLKSQISPENATNKSLTWKSSNDKIATVDQNGNVIAISSGMVSITAISNNSIKGSIDLTIIKKPVLVEEIVLEQSKIKMNIGEELVLNFKIQPEDADNKKVIISSQDDNIVKVVDNKLIAGEIGETTVHVNSEDGHAIALCEVEVVKVEEMVDNLEKNDISEKQNTVNGDNDNFLIGAATVYGVGAISACVMGVAEGKKKKYSKKN